jgi:predicted RNA-binding Zn-ribbon protein involved in translation (DUF1610 family)
MAALVVQQASAAGGVVGLLVIGAVVIGYGGAKWNLMNQSKCIHCGHDNGLTGRQAAICPACGRNKTIFNSKKARKG